ncbi:PAS domain-containing sensor histidine kinase [Lysobacter auxotrophicus]|uniref:histidine kinase n=1 Tax=Lysobacter auxotrophicus TaxID=2992573 RepID=A0ABN6UMB4_9GAMM|nr:PAS domain-containing protein [Lysobacter auxotrophicus]BDU17489.1 PAS domain-containing protein [Lysobacter auxotrophicus]
MSIQFDRLFQHSPNAYMVLDRQMRFVEVNQAYELLTGLPRARLLGRALFEVFPGATNDDGSPQADVLRTSLERAFSTGERDVLALIPYTIESETPNGPVLDVRYWSATHTPLRNDDGDVIAVMQHTTDVTEVHRLREEVRRAREATGVTAEQASEGVLSRAAAVQRDNVRLSARQAFLTDLFEQAPGFMAVLRGPDNVFDLANEAYERLIGRRDFIGVPLREVLPELTDQGFFELLAQVRETGNPFVGRGMPVTLRQDDAEDRTIFVDFIYQPIRDSHGHVEGIFVQGADVTGREAALSALRESEGRFRTIANLVPQMVWSARSNGELDYCNQRWYDFTGLPDGATRGHDWEESLHPDDRDRARALWRRSLATGEPYDIEYRLRFHTGEYRWVLGRALPMRDATGLIVRWMGTCTDIQDQKRVQEMLERSQEALRTADRQKDHFLAMLAHELRNPLAPIATAAQLLKMAPDSVQNVLQASEIIDRQAIHMGNLVEDLMDVSRVTRGLTALKRRRVRLSDIVDAAVEQTMPLMTRRGHRFTLADRSVGVELWADPSRLTQILSNLLNNAAKYTPPNGTVALEIEAVGPDVLLRVRDNGIGIEADMLSRVFELFAQGASTPERHEGGLGIGLALARSLTRLHGGTLTAYSAGPGEGSTFELRLPRDMPPVLDEDLPE